MYRDLLLKQIKIYEEEYENFMGIKEFPVYELQTREASKTITDSRGFEVVASAFYKPQSNRHILLVSTNLTLTKHTMFHEFTHILDSEVNAKGDRRRYMGLSGFTEYHASQVELMQLLGANTINDVISFSMNTIITTVIGEMSVCQYIDEKQRFAIELFSRIDFPADLNTLKAAIGILYGYFGFRSICEAYSINYTEKINNEIFLKFIPTELFNNLNSQMHGWLNKEKIESSIDLYIDIIFPIICKFKLA